MKWMMTKGGADVVVPHIICVALCSFPCLKALQQLLKLEPLPSLDLFGWTHLYCGSRSLLHTK